MGAKAFNVKRDRLADQALDLFDAISSHSDARELGRVGRVTRLAAFNDDRITAHVLGPLNPACQKMLASVPGRNSALGFPATVTVPGLLGWRNWRWLPVCRTNRQPSASISLITARTVMAAT